MLWWHSIKLFLLLLNCNSATVMNWKVNMFGNAKRVTTHHLRISAIRHFYLNSNDVWAWAFSLIFPFTQGNSCLIMRPNQFHRYSEGTKSGFVWARTAIHFLSLWLSPPSKNIKVHSKEWGLNGAQTIFQSLFLSGKSDGSPVRPCSQGSCSWSRNGSWLYICHSTVGPSRSEAVHFLNSSAVFAKCS